MSVAFRRESDEEHKEPRFELPIPAGPNLVTEDGPVTGQEMLGRLIERIMEDAEALDCVSEVESCRVIMQLGSSADHQIRVYRESQRDLAAVSRWIEAATTQSRPPELTRARDNAAKTGV